MTLAAFLIVWSGAMGWTFFLIAEHLRAHRTPPPFQPLAFSIKPYPISPLVGFSRPANNTKTTEIGRAAPDDRQPGQTILLRADNAALRDLAAKLTARVRELEAARKQP